MNSQQAVENALRLIRPVPAEQELTGWRTTLNVLVDDALLELADQIASSDDREMRALLRKTFDVVTTDAEGFASLTPLITASEPLLLKHLNTAEIKIDGSDRRLTLLPDESAVRLDRMPGFPFGALVGTSLLVYNGGAPFEGDVTIRSQCALSLANLPPQLDQRMVMTLYLLGTNQIPSRTRSQVQEVKAVAAEGK